MQVRVNYRSRPLQPATNGVPQLESIKVAEIAEADQAIIRKMVISMGNDRDAAIASRWLASFFFNRATSLAPRMRTGRRR